VADDWSRERLRPLLGPDKKADGLLDEAILFLKLKPAAFSQREALRVLERLSLDESVVGVAARFAKARVLLAR